MAPLVAFSPVTSSSSGIDFDFLFLLLFLHHQHKERGCSPPTLCTISASVVVLAVPDTPIGFAAYRKSSYHCTSKPHLNQLKLKQLSEQSRVCFLVRQAPPTWKRLPSCQINYYNYL